MVVGWQEESQRQLGARCEPQGFAETIRSTTTVTWPTSVRDTSSRHLGSTEQQVRAGPCELHESKCSMAQQLQRVASTDIPLALSTKEWRTCESGRGKVKGARSSKGGQGRSMVHIPIFARNASPLNTGSAAVRPLIPNVSCWAGNDSVRAR